MSSSERAARLVLASTSPQRRLILEQLRIPFDVVAPAYVEADPPGLAPAELVRLHAAGKARSVRRVAAGRFVLGVDTSVVCGDRVFGKPADESEARETLGSLSGRAHEVVSGLCLLSGRGETIEHATTTVWFRSLARREIERYVASREWEGRAGGYAIQGLGATLVERIDGDYLNVVGLPAALLVAVLATHAPGRFGFG